MTRVVCKFGGTSVADPARIGRAADRIAAARRCAGERVAAVISAMGSTTDALLALAGAVAPSAAGKPTRELDLLLATGEQAAAALLALALEERGVPARALTGAQAGIETDATHGDARISAVHGRAVERVLDAGGVPVVAGFQGLDPSGEVTTLGRGGSDTTAVALAIALGAARCDIVTDVDGIHTADPRRVAGARRHARLSHGEALLLARAGAAVLHPRAAALAASHALPVRILSSDAPVPEPRARGNGGPPVEGSDGGTLVGFDGAETATLERGRLLGVVAGAPVCALDVEAAGDVAGAAAILDVLQAEGIAVDRVQDAGASGTATVLVDAALAARALAVLERSGPVPRRARARAPFAPITVVGTGRFLPEGGPRALLEALAAAGIATRGVAFTEPGITVQVESEAADRAVAVLHGELFGGQRSAGACSRGANGRRRSAPAREHGSAAAAAREHGR